MIKVTDGYWQGKFCISNIKVWYARFLGLRKTPFFFKNGVFLCLGILSGVQSLIRFRRTLYESGAQSLIRFRRTLYESGVQSLIRFRRTLYETGVQGEPCTKSGAIFLRAKIFTSNIVKLSAYPAFLID
ncbi:MAG: hypothetical protein DRR19_17015 [Candidatus Parabeggiatoa sp. nov. 1]|nr:MAG: hypothetical protein DRR19_17015 [Gammaproteobacteria bacterium]